MSGITLANELTAWGETKTIAEWARDERATADANIIAKRFESGSEPERAIAYDPNIYKAVVRVARPNELYAFGELKTAVDWSADVQCCVSLNTLNQRLRLGWDIEKALSTPAKYRKVHPKRTYGAITAWGEQKELVDWVLDPRCHGNIILLKTRLDRGYSPEDAIANAARTTDKFKNIEAFGEIKTSLEWSRDPRCNITLTGLRHRLTKGIDPETAISTPSTVRSGSKAGTYSPPKPIEWNGRCMTLEEWSREPECAVSSMTLRARLTKGWTMDMAMLTPIDNPERYAKVQRRPCEVVEYTAFGETKPLCLWYSDPRNKVSQATLRERVKSGYSLQDALKTKLRALKDKKVLPRYRALGSLKTLPEWSHDPRCKVCLSDLNKRMRKGWKIEAALTTPTRDFNVLSESKGRFVTAFGEAKTPGQWVRDPRCKVGQEVLNDRLRAGIPPEIAMTISGGDLDMTTGKIRPMGQTREAFGETKTTREWIADPRCPCTREQVMDRLEQGWDFERALTTPVRTRAEALQALRDSNKKLVTAFGETKSIADWSRDPRAARSRRVISSRLQKGVSPEIAITAQFTGHLARGNAAA